MKVGITGSKDVCMMWLVSRESGLHDQKVIGSEESKRSGYWVEQNIWILQFHKKLAGITSLFI